LFNTRTPLISTRFPYTTLFRSLFDDVFVEIQGKHFVLGQRTSAEEAGVAIELLDLGQLGRQQVAPGIKEPLQSRLDGLILGQLRSEEHTSELQSRFDLVCRLLL